MHYIDAIWEEGVKRLREKATNELEKRGFIVGATVQTKSDGDVYVIEDFDFTANWTQYICVRGFKRRADGSFGTHRHRIGGGIDNLILLREASK